MERKMKPRAFECVTPRRLLYVEEQEDSRDMLVLLLENAGYAMNTATSIDGCLRLIERQSFDLYILDTRYNDGSGLELCRQIRAFDPVTPIVFYSGAARPSDIAAGLKAGAQEYLTKPMGLYTICQTIGELLTETENTPVELQSAYFHNRENGAHSLFSS